MPGSRHCAPSNSRHRAGDEAGFTLLEVLIALAIAIPVLAVLLRESAFAVGASRTAGRYQEAIARATSRLDAVDDGSLVPGERSGDEGYGFNWRTVVVPLSSAPGPSPRPRGAYAGGITLYEVTVEVSWAGTVGDRSVTLSTQRIGPGTGSPP